MSLCNAIPMDLTACRARCRLSKSSRETADIDACGAIPQEQQRWMNRLGEPVGRFHAWWRGDPLPVLPDLLDCRFFQRRRANCRATARIDVREIQERMSRGHRPWLARISANSVGWGWCAAEELSIGELGISRLDPARQPVPLGLLHAAAVAGSWHLPAAAAINRGAGGTTRSGSGWGTTWTTPPLREESPRRVSRGRRTLSPAERQIRAGAIRAASSRGRGRGAVRCCRCGSSLGRIA